MKTQIRRGVFETNSSSTHCLAYTSKTDFDRWVSGELVAHAKNEKETVCSGNYWAYGYDLEYAPANEQDILNKEIIRNRYQKDCVDKMLRMYDATKLGPSLIIKTFFVTYEEYKKYGFEGEYETLFHHDVNDGKSVIVGSIWHS